MRKIYNILIIGILGVLILAIGYSLFIFQSRPNVKVGNLNITISTSVSVTATFTQKPRYLHMEVSPMAFPVIGQSWTIFVYSLSSSSDTIIYRPQPNALVKITTKERDKTIIYNLTVNEIGQSQFLYSGQYEDLAFQAEYRGNQTELISISTHYTSKDTVDNLIKFSGLLVLANGIETILTSFRVLEIDNRKIRITFASLLAFLSIVSAAVFLISVFSKMYLETIWGYPENINKYISFTLLTNITFVVFISILIISVSIGITKLYRYTKEKPQNNK